MDVSSLIEGVLAGDRRAVARAISMVEDGARGLAELSAGLYPHTGQAYTIGLTGSPGVGKSSLAQHLVKQARERNHAVAVLAIDPTSPFTGGALLGDRLRMQEHATDRGVFIRSMATRGHLGGMALAAPEAMRILDASGKDVVMVETVGVGQAEVEVADVFVVNKADKEGAQEAARDLRHMLKMGPASDWLPPVVLTSTVSGEGIDELWDAIEGHRKHQESTGDVLQKRRDRLLNEVEGMAAQEFRQLTRGALEADSELARSLEQREVDPYRAAAILLEWASTPDPHTGS